MWIYEGKEFNEVPEDAFGFVYLITNTLTGKKYIGKKYFTFSRTKQVKGRKRKTRVESDWKEYFGSSTELGSDVAKFGREHFKREILHICKTRGECSYVEAKMQFQHDVLSKPDEYYNSIIQCRIHRKHVLFTPKPNKIK